MGDAKSVQVNVLTGTKPKRVRRADRAVLHMEVDRDAREAFFARARAAGMSGPEFFREALAFPERIFETRSLRMAKPLVNISDFLMRAVTAHKAGDFDAMRSEIDAMRAAFHKELLALSRRHDEEVRVREGGEC